MFIVARLLDHNNGNFIFVALLFIVVARFKYIFNLSLILTTLFATVLSPCMVYGGLSRDLFLSALVADNVHILEFITTLPIKLFVSVIFLLLATYTLIKLRNCLITTTKTLYIVLAILIVHLVIYPPYRTYVVKNYFKGENKEFYMSELIYKSGNFLIRDIANLYINYQEALLEIDKQSRILHAKSDFKPSAVPTEFDTYVVVVGESARRDAHHAYGFKLENTPFLDNVPKLQFNNHTAVGNLTIISLSNTLILNYHKNNYGGNTVLDLAKLAGFKTYWLSNQNELGLFDSIVGGIGKRAMYYHFLNRTDTKNQVFDDTLLIPHIKNALDENIPNKKVIFVHLYGSHIPFCKRTQGKYDVFYISKDLSCYVQTIRNTDSLLKEIYQMLQNNKQQTNKDWALVYFSDHGLAINKTEGSLLHVGARKTNYEVPFVILNSKLTDTKYINAKRSGLNFFDFFAQWTGIKDELLPNNCNFISEEECPNSNIFINSNHEEMDYFSLPDEENNHFR